MNRFIGTIETSEHVLITFQIMKIKGLNVVVILLIFLCVMIPVLFMLSVKGTARLLFLPIDIFLGCFAYVVHVLKKFIEKNDK